LWEGAERNFPKGHRWSFNGAGSLHPRSRSEVRQNECQKRAVIDQIYGSARFAALQASAFEPSVGGHSVAPGELLKRSALAVPAIEEMSNTRVGVVKTVTAAWQV
jgi:hypothetical protein